MMRGSDLLARVDQSMFDLEQEFEDRKAELFSQPLSGHELAGRREYVRMLEVELDEMHEMRREIAQLYNLVGGPTAGTA